MGNVRVSRNHAVKHGQSVELCQVDQSCRAPAVVNHAAVRDGHLQRIDSRDLKKEVRGDHVDPELFEEPDSIPVRAGSDCPDCVWKVSREHQIVDPRAVHRVSRQVCPDGEGKVRPGSGTAAISVQVSGCVWVFSSGLKIRLVWKRRLL